LYSQQVLTKVVVRLAIKNSCSVAYRKLIHLNVNNNICSMDVMDVQICWLPYLLRNAANSLLHTQLMIDLFAFLGVAASTVNAELQYFSVMFPLLRVVMKFRNCEQFCEISRG
jgi:hypothetical protein